MGIIRDNQDYYVSLGYSPSKARVLAEMDRRGIDYGYCNPVKAKFAAEEEAEIERELREKES